MFLKQIFQVIIDYNSNLVYNDFTRVYDRKEAYGIYKNIDESIKYWLAAGEVVENPASMIKEMVENSLDAKASMIKIEIFNCGLTKITDNGVGMDKEDALLCIERHATSKIRTKDDVSLIWGRTGFGRGTRHLYQRSRNLRWRQDRRARETA